MYIPYYYTPATHMKWVKIIPPPPYKGLRGWGMGGGGGWNPPLGFCCILLLSVNVYKIGPFCPVKGLLGVDDVIQYGGVKYGHRFLVQNRK